jgi:hypothetical protein
MQVLFPWLHYSLKRNAIIWKGTFRPFAGSKQYTVQIQSEIGRRPKVSILAPSLTSYPNEKVPHTFSDGSLCLHLNEEWSGRFFIADVIMPWLAEWLFFYETWLVTGKWHGGGHGEDVQDSVD